MRVTTPFLSPRVPSGDQKPPGTEDERDPQKRVDRQPILAISNGGSATGEIQRRYTTLVNETTVLTIVV